MSDPGGTTREWHNDRLPLSMPPALRSHLALEDSTPPDIAHTPTKEACAAWERSLRPGQYFSEHGGRRPMRHRTQAVQGHPGARSWPRGPDGGAWGPQELSPIPSEGSYMPLVPSPTTSPGRRSPVRGAKYFFPGQRASAAVEEETAEDNAALADVVAAEIGIEGLGRDVLKPFEPIHLADETLPPPPPAAPLEAPWRAPPPGFDLRTLRRQASTLRGEAAAACRDEEQVRLSNLQLAETLSATVRNGRDNVSAARERLRCLHTALRRLRAERRIHGEAVRAAVSWRDSLEQLREKLASTEERKRRAEWAEIDARRALEATVDANRVAEEEIVALEHALEAARRRDDVAVAIELRTQQEDLADAFHLRRCHGGGGGGGDGGGLALDASSLVARNTATHSGGTIDREEITPGGSRFASPLLMATMSWAFQAFTEACRRSKGMRRLAAVRDAREEVERLALMREVLTAWAIGATLERRERGAQRRRAEEAARLCLARWRLFAALERRFRVERRRRTCLRVVGAWRDLVKEGRRRRDLDQRREVLVLRRCFRGWRVLRAKSTLTSQEYSERCRVADRHRLSGLFDTWHLAALASAASSAAAVRGFQSRRGVATLAGNFRVWASLSRARRWRRLRRLRRGLDSLASFAEFASGSWPRRFYRAGAATQDASNTQRGFLPWEAEGAFRRGGEGRPEERALTAGPQWRRQAYGGQGADGSRLSRLSSAVSFASAHRRRVALSKGLRALRFGTAQTKNQLLVFDHRGGDGVFGGFSTRLARSALSAWRASAATQRRSRALCASAEYGYKRRCLVRSLRAWRHLVAAEARQRRADRAHMLKRSFVALRQACATSRRQRAACRALCNVFRSRREALLGFAMERLSAGPSTAAAAAAARAKAGAARRRRERESLGAAWRWWVSGWLRRQAQGIRMRELEERRRRNRDRDLQEELMQAEEASSALSKEALAVETALESTKLLALEQEEALAMSMKSLAEASAASATMKARLGPSTRVKIKGRKRALAPAVDNMGVCRGGKGGGGGGRSTKAADDEDRRLRARRLACQRAAASALAGVEARRKAAEESVAARERSTEAIRTKLRRQEEADQVKLQETLDEVRRYRDAVDAGHARLEEAEAERLRVRAESARLLERVNTLARRAEEEATKGARGASSAESERAALSVEVSTAEARTKEVMVILDEREKEAAELRRALAARETARQEKCLSPTAVGVAATWTVTPDVPVELALSKARKEMPGSGLQGAPNQGAEGGRLSPPSGDASPDDFNVQELKESIALLRAKVESSSFASGT